MGKKTDQHIVPRAYLKYFIDSSSSKGIENFEAGVFVNSANLDKPWKMKGLGNNIFTETRFYNLASDDPESPIIENYLSIIENHYAKAIGQLLDGKFSNEIFWIISTFVCIQFFRAKSTLNNAKKHWDKLSEWADMFEGGDRNRTLYGEISKKGILNLANTETVNLLHKNAVIIINRTRIPFLTSDKPVIQCLYNREDIMKIFWPINQEAYTDEHLESAFYFMPLTPRLAYMSHNSFKNDIKGFECQYENVISQLNDLMISSADEHIYSCIPVEILPEVISQNSNSKYFKVVVFTESKRVIFEAIDYRRDNGLLILELINVCDELVEGEQLVSVEVFDLNVSNNLAVTCIRGCGIKTINKLGNQIVFESNIPMPF